MINKVEDNLTSSQENVKQNKLHLIPIRLMNIKKINDITLVPRPGIEPQPLPWKGKSLPLDRRASPFHLCPDITSGALQLPSAHNPALAHIYFAQFYFFSTDFLRKRKEGKGRFLEFPIEHQEHIIGDTRLEIRQASP